MAKLTQAQYHQQLQGAKTQADLDRIIAAAKAQGVSLGVGQVQQAQMAVRQAAAKQPAAPKQSSQMTTGDRSAAYNKILNQINSATTATQIKSAVDSARAQGMSVDMGTVNSAFTRLVNTSKSLAELNAITSVAKTVNASADQASISRITNQIQQAEAAARAKEAQLAAEAKTRQQQATTFGQAALEAKTQAELDKVKADAARAGVTIEKGMLDRATTTLQQRQTMEAKAQQEKTSAEFQTKLNTAKTAAEVKAIVDQAKAAGAPINQGYVDAANQAVAVRERQAAEQAQRNQLEQYHNQVRAANDQIGIDRVVAEAREAGLTINPGVIQQTQNQIKMRESTANFVKTLGEPTGFATKTAPNGLQFVSIGADPVTGKPGAWYQYTNTGFQQIDDAGRLTGAVIPEQQFNQQRQAAQANYQNYASAQQKAADAAKLAEQVKTFEQKLLQPDQRPFRPPTAEEIKQGYRDNFNASTITGPDGRFYIPLPADRITGQPARWVASTEGFGYGGSIPQRYTEVGKSNAPVENYQQVNQTFTNNQIKAQQEYEAARQRQIDAVMAKRNSSALGDLFADFDKLVNKTVGWKTIATIAGGAVGGPLGATLANATAGAVKGESLEQIAKGAALTYAMAYGAQALGKALQEGISTGISTGQISATDDVLQFADDISNNYAPVAQAIDDVHGLSDLPKSVIDAAMATDDPIAALNAAQGFTNVDTSYLRQIGASDDLLAVAQAHNTVNGYTGVGGSFIGGDYSAIPDEFIGPPSNLANYTPPAPVEPFAPGSPEYQAWMQGQAQAAGPQAPGSQYASTGPTPPPSGSATVTNLTDDQLYQRFVDQGMNPSQAYQTVYGNAPPSGYATPQTNPPMNLDLPNMGQTTPVTPTVVNPGAGISTPGGFTPGQIAAGIAVPAVIGGAIAAGSGGGGAATTPGPVAPPTTVTNPPVAEVTPTPQGDIINGVPTPANPTAPVPEPVVTPPVPAQPVTPPVVIPPVPQPAPAPVPQPAPAPAPQPQPAPATPGTGPATPGTGPATPGTGPATPGTGPATSGGGTTPGVPGGSSQVIVPNPNPTVPTQPVVTPGSPGQAPITDYSTPYQGQYSDQSVLERYLSGGISFDGVTKLIAAGLVLPSVLGLIAGQPQGPTIKRPNYGPIPPVNWGAAGGLVMPGVNPGFVINPAQTPFYQTTDPVQSQYAWTQRPLIQQPQDIESTWLNPAVAPAQPWGLQRSQQAYDLNQVLNQINQQPLDPNFAGYSNLPTPGYQPPGLAPIQPT